MADERLPCRRSWSIAATMSDKVKSRLAAISFNPVQNASSKLTLVLCPAMTIERLTTGDFIGFSCLDTVLIQLAANPRFCSTRRAHGRLSTYRGKLLPRQPVSRHAGDQPLSGQHGD